jgi:dipeptidyl aminopeptidase/acylaminoacyl peptidase
MAALDPALDLKAAVLWYPAVDLRAFDTLADARPMVEALLGGSYSDEVMLAASPVAHVAPGAPPMLTMTGDDDALTTVADITRFHELLDDAGAANELVVFKSRDHGFDYHPADWTVCQARMTAFLDRVL